MFRGDDLEVRLVDFAVLVIKLCDRLPSSPAATHIGRQLLRSGTAPAPHFAEARSAESRRDFVHKLKIALKEMNESRVWMKMIVRSGLSTEADVKQLAKECDELCRILSASITTSKHRNIQKSN